MSPIPPLGLVQKLSQFDKDLRIRWATHQKLWLIELKAKERQPGYLAEKPSAFGTTPRALDAWDSWRQGYVYVTKLRHPIEYPWEFIAAHLKHLSLEAHQAKDRLLERLEAAEAEEEAAIKRAWDVGNEAAAKQIYDDMSWAEGRTVSLNQPGAHPKEEAREGYVVVDRRVTA